MMMQAGELEVHIRWQYIHMREIWQEDIALNSQFSEAIGIDTCTCVPCPG
jgi:hypothetical protein